MKNSDMPAMPYDFTFESYEGTEHEMFSGLTKREHFAGLAMQGFIAAGVMGMPSASEIAELSIKYAEEALRQLGE
jgi:hypothetical protein